MAGAFRVWRRGRQNGWNSLILYINIQSGMAFPPKARVLLPQEVLRLTRMLRVSAGVTGNTPRQTCSDSGLTVHSPQEFHSRRTRKNHPAPFSSLLGLWDWNQLHRGEGRAAARSFQCPHGKELCTAGLTQACLTLLHGAFPSQLHLWAF